MKCVSNSKIVVAIILIITALAFLSAVILNISLNSSPSTKLMNSKAPSVRKQSNYRGNIGAWSEKKNLFHAGIKNSYPTHIHFGKLRIAL